MTAPIASSSLEATVRAVSGDLDPGDVGLRGRLDEFVIASVMRNHDLRVGLFRFAEAFPAMEGPDDVMAHLRGYLGHDAMPWWVRLPIALAARIPFGSRIAAWAADRGISTMAKNFIGGRRAADVEPLVRRHWDAEVGVIIDALGEKTVTADQADDYAARILDIVAHLGRAAGSWPASPGLERDQLGVLPRVAVAIKPTGLSAKYQPLSAEIALADVRRRLDPIMQAATEHDVMVWFDMEQYAVKTLTQRLFADISHDWPNAHIGIVVQAYLRDSFDDLQRIIAQERDRRVPIGIRLVKGAYWDYETVVASAHGWPQPVYDAKVDTDANFERCSLLLVDNADVVRPSFASHNVRSLAHALAAASVRGLPKSALEIQALHGMGGDLAASAAKAGIRSRIYVPVGELVPGMSYLVRRLLENTSNESFIRQNRSKQMSRDQLLAAPRFTSKEDAA
ncbi:MAG: hypothetical protein HKN07_03560 [Acidimicrobiia bacterium]|nr:hypothetical protein [Acidimicrobiia bacterium]